MGNQAGRLPGQIDKDRDANSLPCLCRRYQRIGLAKKRSWVIAEQSGQWLQKCRRPLLSRREGMAWPLAS